VCKAIEVVDPVLEFFNFIVAFSVFAIVVWLWQSLQETIGSMALARYMLKFEMEGQYRDNPSIYTSRQCNVGVVEHALDVSRIDLYDEVANADEEHLVCAKGAI
jgi:hypothetical protein